VKNGVKKQTTQNYQNMQKVKVEAHEEAEVEAHEEAEVLEEVNFL
jgi:hypothetical protein